jgi:hypothetical protein
MVTGIIIIGLCVFGGLSFVVWISMLDEFDNTSGIVSAVCFVLAIIVYCFGCNFKAETTTDSVPMRVITCDSIPSWDSNSENKISSHVTYRITVTDDSNKYDSLTFDVSKKVFDKYNVNDTIIVEVESKYRPLFESSKVKYKISDAG